MMSHDKDDRPSIDDVLLHPSLNAFRTKIQMKQSHNKVKSLIDQQVSPNNLQLISSPLFNKCKDLQKPLSSRDLNVGKSVETLIISPRILMTATKQ